MDTANKETNDTSECETYRRIYSEFLKHQDSRGFRRNVALVFGTDGSNNNREAEKKTQLDLAFQSCQLSKLDRMEKRIAKMEDSQITSSFGRK